MYCVQRAEIAMESQYRNSTRQAQPSASYLAGISVLLILAIATVVIIIISVAKGKMDNEYWVTDAILFALWGASPCLYSISWVIRIKKKSVSPPKWPVVVALAVSILGFLLFSDIAFFSRHSTSGVAAISVPMYLWIALGIAVAYGKRSNNVSW